MSKTHEPINYLDRILNEEETRSLSTNSAFQWRNYTISRSGRFKSKNRKREIVDGNIFDKATTDADVDAVTVGSGDHYSNVASLTDNDKHSTHSSSHVAAAAVVAFNKSTTCTRGVRDKVETIKSYYETNL